MEFPTSIAWHKPRGKAADYDDESDGPGYFPVTFTPIEAGVFNLYLFGPIYHPTQFIPFIEALNRAGPNDVVRIHLSTPGGSLDATDTFLAAVRECDARVIVHASGGVHSAGSVILLSADEFTLSENFNMLIHNGSCGAGGDMNKFVAWAKHNQDYMEKTAWTTYTGFLTNDEIQAMIDGKDFWLDGEEFVRRWEARNEIMKGQPDMIEHHMLGEDEPRMIPAGPAPKRKRK